jgi:hypothetical protein
MRSTNIADVCTFCQDVRADRYKEYGITPGIPLISDNGQYVERAMRTLHDSGRRDAARNLGYMAAGLIGVPMRHDSDSGLYVPSNVVTSGSQREYKKDNKNIERREALKRIGLTAGALYLLVKEASCGGGSDSPPPPPPPPPPSQTTVSLNIKDILGSPVTNENFRSKYGSVEKETIQNINGKYTNTFDKTTTAQQLETRTGQTIAGGTTPWYRMTRSEGSILLNDTVLSDVIALMRMTESGNTTLYRHLLNLYRYMTGTDVAPATKLQKYPSLTSQNGVDVNLNHILGVDQYVNAARNSALPAWAAGLLQSKKLYTEVTQNPDFGLYFTYANRGTSAPSFNTILKPLGTDSNGNPAVKNFEIEVNTAYNVNTDWINTLIHVLGHGLLCLFREDPSTSNHIMNLRSNTIQPIEFSERDWQAYLVNAHDMGLYPLETS